jgi:hypothetical protein
MKMAKLDENGRRIITFLVAQEVAAATEALAAKEYSNVSAICRKALVRDLKEAGLLAERESA